MARRRYGGFRPYVPVAQRRARANRHIAALRKGGRDLSPVVIEGRKIAHTFWGKAWCDNLERYSDFASRLPRGRTYARNGSVIDLQISAGAIAALVAGSDLYEVDLRIAPLPNERWAAVRKACGGEITSVLDLLQGRLSGGVMSIVTRAEAGLFPSPSEIQLDCSCPDWATMCKHVAAVLYGVGARLDHAPDKLFLLRGVDPEMMVTDAIAHAKTRPQSKGGRHKRLSGADLSELFGVDIEGARRVRKRSKKRRAAHKK